MVPNAVSDFVYACEQLISLLWVLIDSFVNKASTEKDCD